MPPTVFVMCQGHQARIGHLLNGPKQLVEIQGSETIFERTVRLVRSTGPGVRIVAVTHGTHHWAAPIARAGCEMFVQRDPGSSVVGAIRNVEPMWGSDTFVLLGDVIFSKASIQNFMKADTSAFIGRRGGNPVTKKRFPEIFGLTFHNDEARRQILEATADFGWRSHQDTKLWDLLGKLCWPLHETGDYTDDLDTHDDYVKHLPVLRGAVTTDI